MASPRRRSTRWISPRPVRPLPSANGWMVSNCACASAAWATAGSESSLQNAHRSSIRPGTSSGGGGTNAAEHGL